MIRLRTVVSATSLVLFPLLIFLYWLFYPAYGLLEPEKVVRAIDGHAAVTTFANACALAGSFLAVAASLALMRVLEERSPRLAVIGGALSVLGWTALVGALMPDVLAIQMTDHGGLTPAFVDLFRRFSNSPTMIALNVLALFHVIGGVLLGVALIRTRIVPRWAGWTAALTPVIHLSSNIAGLLWIDEVTWIAVAAAYACVARTILRRDAPRADERRA